MQKTFTLILVLFTTLTFAQIPNAGFENWSNGSPAGWTTNNSIAGGLVTETNDAYAGNEAAMLNVVGTNGGSISATFAVPAIPDSLYGWYLGNFVSGDVLLVQCSTKSGTTATSGALGSFSTTAVIYKKFGVKYSATPGSAADSASITLSLHNSTGSVNAGTSSIIDALSFGAYLSDGIAPVTGNAFLQSCMPNPATNTASIIFSLNGSSNVNLALYDVTGKKVKTLLENTELTDGQYKLPVDVTSLPAGVYLYTLLVNGQQYTQKMVVAK